MGGISIWQIAIIVIIVAVLFGGKRLRNLGGDLGTSLKGFKKAMSDEKPINIEQSDTEATVSKVEETVTTEKEKS